MTFGRYDVAAMLTFMVYAFGSMAVPMTLVPLSRDLNFPLDGGGMGLGGLLQIARAAPMVGAMLFCGFMAGRWGKRVTLGVSILLMASGMILAGLAPLYGVLFTALLIAGLGEGVIEGLATPYVQDLHPHDSGRYQNLTHSFWSVGVLVLVLTAGVLLTVGVSWRYILVGSGVCGLVPATLFLVRGGNRSGATAGSARSNWREVLGHGHQVVKSRRFWLFFAAMFFAGGGEFCLTFWCASFIQIEFAGTAWAAGAGTACFAAGMFVGRFFSGLYVHQHNLKKLILIAAALSVVLVLPFPWLQSLWPLFILLFLSGIVAGPFWPSIQTNGTTRIRGDHTMMMILFSCAGVPGCGVFTLLIGVFGDLVGLRMSFLLVPFCFLMVFILMGKDALDQRRERLGGAVGGGETMSGTVAETSLTAESARS